ncbi:beta-glucosidase [Acetobacter senegalensis]|uniref:Beta-D-glucoside glucohydrolase n=1 Tax=Acetobacter senegalensis TaxID=446692 RepID=A0A149TU20_9PROT|nr:glycoside hydrolase family 3 C-terminal domain-containing protein [Acetobacter senegalensis]KXV56640.1 beta-glucosidase [Acetobacter senegalensis]
MNTSAMPSSYDVDSLVSQMTIDEKIDMIGGFNMWKTRPIERLGLPSITMTDGTYGVRYSVQQIDKNERGGENLDSFLGVVNRKADDVQTAWGQMKPATCFPNGSSLACSWDTDLATQLGEALGKECRNLGVHLLLGPGINIRRTPLAGRAYEYYSEDPVLSADLAAAVINGIQKYGVGTSLKHFVCNDSEVERTTMDSIVEERALREIYLLAFERAIAKSNPWSVMTSYNRVNGEQTAQSAHLINGVLRNDWGYSGTVIADWHGIKDRGASILAGNDLDMPESPIRKADLKRDLADGRVNLSALDTACANVIRLVLRCHASKMNNVQYTEQQHHVLSRKFAEESIVLLKNDNKCLPLSAERLRKVVILGKEALEPVIQGSGCATTTPTQVDIPFDEISSYCSPETQVVWLLGTAPEPEACVQLKSEALTACLDADIVILFAAPPVGYDGEGSDRSDLNLAPGYDDLITTLGQAERPYKLIVILSNPDAVAMPWVEHVDAVLDTFFSGQGMGRAVANILFGKTVPSGKLTTTFPVKKEDIPGYLSYPGENGRHYYSEGCFVGYRYFDARDSQPLFPFGFGLSYTTFEYSDLILSKNEILPLQGLDISFNITNTGLYEGKEIAQVYLRGEKCRLKRCKRDLRGFCKISLKPGETKRVTITLESRDFEVYDTERQKWLLDNGILWVDVGASSRDIRLSQRLKCLPGVNYARKMTFDLQPVFVFENPVAVKILSRYMMQQLNVDKEACLQILEHGRNSFIGIFATLERRLQIDIPSDTRQELVDQINAEMNEVEKKAYS